MLTAAKRLQLLQIKQRNRRDSAFEGPIPSYELFLQMRGADAEMTEQIEAVKNELSGNEEGD